MKSPNYDVVISGIGGVFPKSKNIEELKQHLLANDILLEERWKRGERGCSNSTGVVDCCHFDNAYFGIHREQCVFMDPMHRIILESTFEALIDAGVNPQEVRGRRIGCYLAGSIGENDNFLFVSIVGGFGITGHSRAMMANRISYWLNLNGPSETYDCNWVGGMEVLRKAYDAVKSGQLEACIIGSANLIVCSEIQYLFNDSGVLSQDGSIKSFDAEASGYARTDGMVVMYIQRAKDAKRCYGSIQHVATLFDGNREGDITEIDEDNLTEFVTEFYKNAKVDPRDVEFVEADGTAIKDVDKKELSALERVFCKDRKSPLLVGSIKPNTGHAEASSVLFSVAKAVIAMENDVIPATVQYNKPNPEIPALINGSVQVVSKNLKWNPKYVAVNAIGFDSYYGHLLLKANPKKLPEKLNNLPRLLLASTRTEAGIQEILETFETKEDINDEYVSLVQNVYSKPIPGHLYRGYSLRGSEEVKSESESYLGNKRQVWFVYSGMGSQWPGMASDLMKIPVFNEAIQKCQAILQTKGVDLLTIITNTDKSMFDNILHSFVGIAAIQIGLTDVLHSIGITPDGIIGHSVGELGCAYADGCVSAEQMILCAYSRGKASLEAKLIPGMMAAIGLGFHQIKDKCPPSIQVACHNGPDSCTISGPTEDMEKFVKQLQGEGIFARLVNVSNIAYHSRYIKPAAPLLLDYLKEVIPTPVPRSKKWISTSNLEANWGTHLAQHSSAEYHTNNLLSSVLFEEGLQYIPKDSVLIEIAPHGLLQAILKRSLKPGCTSVPLTHRGTQKGVEFLFNSIGKLYLSGLDMKAHNLYPKVEFPVSRGTPSLSSLVHWDHSDEWKTGMEDRTKKNKYGIDGINISLSNDQFRELIGHQLDDEVIFPSSVYLKIIAKIISTFGGEHEEIVFENLHFNNSLRIPDIGGANISAMMQKGSGSFEILADDETVVTGKVTYTTSTDAFMFNDTDVEMDGGYVELFCDDIYDEFQHRGCKYSNPFKPMKNLKMAENGSIGTLQWNGEWHLFLEGMLQQYLLHAGERDQDIQVPRTIQKIALYLKDLPSEQSDLTVHYNYSTEILATKGIQIVGVTSTSKQRRQRDISYDSVEFFPLKNRETKMENFLNAAVHLAIDNFGVSEVPTIMITEIETPVRIESSLRRVLAHYKRKNPHLTSVSSFEEVSIQQDFPSLFIYNGFITQDLVRIITASNGYALVKTSNDISAYSQVFQLAERSINGTSYSLLRKVISNKPKIVVVREEKLSTKDFSQESKTWLNELTKLVNNSNEIALLVSTVIPDEGLVNFVHALRSIPKMQKVCCFFNFDQKSSKINVDDPLYETIYKYGMGLSILKDNLYGTYLPVPISLKDDLTSSVFSTSNVIDDKNIQYLSVNLADETIDPEFLKPVQLGNIDYSGMTSDGKAIMGLARVNKDTSKIEPDPILHWEIPDVWTIEDGATIPHAYTCAYYALKYKTDMKRRSTVLVHGGCTSIGMAAICVASALGYTVYTTVSNDIQRTFLKNQFVFLQDFNILSCSDSSFAPIFMNATGGRGADILMNCLSGTLLQASIDCVADHGIFIHYGHFDLEENTTVGMRRFLRNISFVVINFNHLLSLPANVKHQLKNGLWEEMLNLGVRPLYRKVVEHQDVGLILDNMRRSGNFGKVVMKLNDTIEYSRFNVRKSQQFICDAKSSYLVHGGTAEGWTDVTEWLVIRGARRVVVASESKPKQAHIERRLSLLKSYFGAEIIISQSRIQSEEAAIKLLSDVHSLGKIHLVFLLPSESTPPKINDNGVVHYVDHFLRKTTPEASLVNFINGAEGFTQARTDAGFSAFNIQCDKGLEFSFALNHLDKIICHKVRNALIRDDKVDDAYQELTAVIIKKLDLILPPSIEKLTEQYQNAPLESKFIQLSTLGPRKIRELAPIFVLPGQCNESEIEDLALQLFYPTFCAVYSNQIKSISEVAEVLVSRMKEIWPKGPYTLIGVSSGGPLTMEIARILEQQKDIFHIYLIDGAPKTLQMSLQHLGETSESMEMNIINRLFKIADISYMEKLRNLRDWRSKVALALQDYQGELKDKDAATEALTNLKYRLGEISTYRQSDVTLSGEIHLLRPTGCTKHDGCDLFSVSKRTLQVHVIEGDHRSIVRSPETALLINQTFSLV